MKLTKPQRELLLEASKRDDGKAHCHPQYAPAVKLIEMGLMEAIRGTFGHHIYLTAAGWDEAKKEAKPRSSGRTIASCGRNYARHRPKSVRRCSDFSTC